MPAKATRRRREQRRAEGMGQEEKSAACDEMKSLAVSKYLPKRPDTGGSLGKPETLVTNHFLVNFNPNQPVKVTQYDAQISRLFFSSGNSTGGKGGAKKEGKDRGIPLKKRDELMELFREFVKAYPDVFGPESGIGQRLIYDRVKFLYAAPELDLTGENSFTLAINGIYSERDRKKNQPANYQLKLTRLDCVRADTLQKAYLENGDASRFGRNRPARQLLEILFRQGFFFNDTFSLFGAGLYKPFDRERMDLGSGRELLRGLFQSIHVVSGWKITLNVDAIASAFYKYEPANAKSGLKLIGEILADDCRYQIGGQQLNQYQFDKLERAVKGLKFKTTHLGHGFMCVGLGPTPQKYKFKDEDYGNGQGKMMTTVEYFRQKYNINLTDSANLPMLMKKSRNPATGRVKETYYPIELCILSERQRVPNGKLSDMDHTKIIRATAEDPIKRLERTRLYLHQAEHNNHAALKYYGLKLNDKPIETRGRLLNPPGLQYKEKQVLNPVSGVWNMSQNRLFQPMAPLKRWSVMVVHQRGSNNRAGPRQPAQLDLQTVRTFLDHLIRTANNLGICMSSWLKIQETDYNGLETTFDQLINDCKDGPIQWILTISPSKDAAIYGKLKFLSESKRGVSQSNLLAANVWRVVKEYNRNQNLLANICLKLNTKMGGVNAQLADTPNNNFVSQLMKNRKPVFIGVDVTHPDPGDKHSPSIAAICGSLDRIPHKYKAVECLMPHRKEILPISILSGAVRDLLLAYYGRNEQAKPDHIVYYRDGVSEGQFKELLLEELAAIQKACSDLDADYKPPITFVVVQKRHHTRLYRKDINRADRAPRQNITAGTVVDTEIVHPYEFDFFLCSHQGIQGTSKPTHYHVLYDDMGYSSDQLQMLTYNLCHAFARCTRSVSLPAPVYYAHLTAYRARVRLQGSGKLDKTTADSMSEDEWKRFLTGLKECTDVKEGTKLTMYFQ